MVGGVGVCGCFWCCCWVRLGLLFSAFVSCLFVFCCFFVCFFVVFFVWVGCFSCSFCVVYLLGGLGSSFTLFLFCGFVFDVGLFSGAWLGLCLFVFLRWGFCFVSNWLDLVFCLLFLA